MINSAKDFAEYANKIINGISCLYLVEKEIMAEPQDIEKSLKISRTLKVHKVSRTYIEDKVCEMEFDEVGDETDPFHVSHSVVPQRGRPGRLWAQSASTKL